MAMDISQLLTFAYENKASDLHLSAGMPPCLRIHGDVRKLETPPLEHKDVHAMVYDIMSDAQRKEYEKNLEADFSFPCERVAAKSRRRRCVSYDSIESSYPGRIEVPPYFP